MSNNGNRNPKYSNDELMKGNTDYNIAVEKPAA